MVKRTEAPLSDKGIFLITRGFDWLYDFGWMNTERWKGGKVRERWKGGM